MKRNGLIRFITAGSVDDGKSTLIGRLLYDSKLVLTDQLHNLVNAKSSRASENEIDFSFNRPLLGNPMVIKSFIYFLS